MQKEKEIIEYLVKNGDGELPQCNLVFRTICSAPEEERAKLLEWFIIYSMMTEGNSSLNLSEDEETGDPSRLKEMCGRRIGNMIRSLNKLNLAEDDFYRKLWNYISDPQLFSSGTEQSAAMYACINGSGLPYFRMDENCAPDISGTEYESLYDSIGIKEVCKMRCIAERRFSHVSKQAEQLLRMIERQPSAERKIVMMAELINYYRENSLLSIMDLDIEDLEDDDNEEA